MAGVTTVRPAAQERPAPTPGRERPDPRPARLMMGAGALAAVSIIGAGLVDYPATVADSPAPARVETRTTRAERVQRPVRYVHLKPGQKAPKGATVIEAAAPAPRVVVRRIVTPASSGPTRAVARSRQSGR